MKGLLFKDIRLSMEQKLLLPIVIFVSVFLLASKQNYNFILGYVVCLFGFVSMTTLSYDEFEHGMAFLLVLPVSRRTYVREKYVFGLAVDVLAGVIGVVAITLFRLVRDPGFSLKEWLCEGYVICVCSLFLPLVMIPLVLKFGMEKGRIVLMLIFGLIFAAGYMAQKMDWMQERLAWMGDQLQSLPAAGFAVGFTAGVALLFVISLKCSEWIILSQEY